MDSTTDVIHTVGDLNLVKTGVASGERRSLESRSLRFDGSQESCAVPRKASRERDDVVIGN